MEQEEFFDYKNCPSLNSFTNLRKDLNSLMSYRKSPLANQNKIKKRGRLLWEYKEFQFIEFDLQHCIMSMERRNIQKEALAIAQNISFISDPEEIQAFQNSAYQDQKNMQDKREPFQNKSFYNDDSDPNQSFINDSYFTQNPVNFGKPYYNRVFYSSDANNNATNDLFGSSNNNATNGLFESFNNDATNDFLGSKKNKKNDLFSFESNENSFEGFGPIGKNSKPKNMRSRFTSTGTGNLSGAGLPGKTFFPGNPVFQNDSIMAGNYYGK